MLSYLASDTITFYTAAEIEARAWAADRGIEAAKAAGKIHTDLERGFIGAEVVAYDDFLDCLTYVEARRRGLYRNEGKTYVIKDGDIINILFNVSCEMYSCCSLHSLFGRWSIALLLIRPLAPSRFSSNFMYLWPVLFHIVLWPNL